MQSLKKNRIVSLALSIILFVITAYALFAAKNGNRDAVETSGTIILVVAVISLAIGIWGVAIVYKLGEFGNKFKTAFILVIANTALAFVKYVIDLTVVKLAVIAVSLLYSYFFYKALEEMTMPVSKDVALRWKNMWTITVSLLATSVVLAISLIIAIENRSVSMVIVDTLSILALSLGLQGRELVTIYKTVDALK